MHNQSNLAQDRYSDNDHADVLCVPNSRQDCESHSPRNVDLFRILETGVGGDSGRTRYRMR
jgi:hypothetical protein